MKSIAAVWADQVHRHPHILRARGHLHQDESHRVGPVAVDNVARIDAVAQRLAHPLTVAVLDHGVDIDVTEGQCSVAEVAVEHHHP